jgi:cytochrome c oxidase subunit 2
VRSNDVIHSFWVPELNRKMDTIPGRTRDVLIEANRVGFYRGACAEYCGLQHAHMNLAVYAEPPAQFRAWLANMAAPARGGAQPPQFARLQCAGCHVVRGTNAHGLVGPDLTHVATRKTLASLTVKNTPRGLRDWIRGPQHFKPGNLMPNIRMSDSDLEALASYLEGLK